MKGLDIVNEVFEIGKMKEVGEIQKGITALNNFIAKNPDAAKGVAGAPTQIGSNFQAILATFMQQQKAEEEAKKKKAEEDRMKLKTQPTIGSTIPVKPAAPVQQGNVGQQGGGLPR